MEHTTVTSAPGTAPPRRRRSPPSRRTVVSSASNMMRISRRASAAPRQKCGPPPPNDDVVVGRAAHVERERILEHVLVAVRRRVPERDRRRLRRIVSRASSTSRVAVRRKYETGELHRRISSTAVSINPGSARSRASCSGCSTRRQQPAGDRVAGRLGAGGGEQEEEQVDLVVGEPRRRAVVVDDLGRAPAPTRCRRWDSAACSRCARDAYANSRCSVASRSSRPTPPSGSNARRIVLVLSNTIVRSPSGIPMMSAMTCSGSSSATSATKSTSPPAATTASRMRSVRHASWLVERGDHLRA